MKFNYLFFGLLLLLFTSQAFAITDTNLVAYYDFNNTSGDLIDLKGYDNNGSNTGVTYSQTGKINSSYLYQGRSVSSKTAISPTGFNTTGNLTISFWIKGTIQGSGENPNIFSWGNSSSSSNIGCLHWDNSSTAYLTCNLNENNTSGLTTSTNVLNNNWNMITMTWNGTDYNIYVNGSYKGTKSKSGTISGSSFHIGDLVSSPTNTQFLGNIDEFSIWNKVLSQSEVTELYNSGAGLTYPFTTEYINVDFNYIVRKDLNKVILKDTSTVSGVTKTAWTWTNNGSTISTAQDYNLTATELTDYNICLHVDTNVSDINGDKCYQFNTGDWSPPVTNFSSFQVPNTTDQNITLTCTDNNTGCKTINYNINNEGWVQKLVNNADLNYFKNFEDNNYLSPPFELSTFTNTPTLSITNATTMRDNYYFNTTATGVTVGYTRTQALTIPNDYDINYSFVIRATQVNGTNGFSLGNETTTSISNSIANFMLRTTKFQYTNSAGADTDICATAPSINTNYIFTLIYKNNDSNAYYEIKNDAGALICGGELEVKSAGVPTRLLFYGNNTSVTSIDNLNVVYAYVLNSNPYSFLYSGTGDHNILYYSTDLEDNTETTKTSNFTTYGNGRFYFKDENSGSDLTGVQVNFNGVDYNSGANNYLDFNFQTLSSTNTPYLFTISKSGYSTRYYQIDLNYFSSFDINFALLPDSLDSDVPFKVYKTDETTIFSNTYVEVKDSDNNWTIGRLKTNSSGETTFNLRADDSNYNAIINNGEFTYIPVTVSVLYPKNEETLVQITEKWKIEITQNLYASYTDLNATKIIYLLPNTSLPYNIKISDMNGNYFPRTYAKTYPGNPLTDTLQPYLVSESTGLLTTINAISATTNQPLEGITFRVYKYISGLGRTFVEQLTTDSKGQALSLLVLGDSYEFEAYNGSVLLKNFPITATSSTIFFVLSLGSEVITQPGNSGFSSKFTPGNIINLETIGSQGFSQTLYNFGDENITIASTIKQNGANLAAPQNYSGSSNKTFTYTVAWASIVKGTIIQKMVVTTSDGNVYTFDQNIQVIESYGTGYNPIDGLQNGLRQDLTCSSNPLVPCYPLLVLAFLICVAVTIWATVQFGVYGGQSAGLIFLVGMILFTYLTWIPVWITAGLVLIILAFIVNERR
jgi:hypothetical protein